MASSVLERLRSLTATVAAALPAAGDLAVLSAAEEVEATQLLGAVRSRIGESISLLASDIDRRSARELGTEGLAQKNGFKDAAGFVQNLIGTDRGDASRLIRVGGLLETAHTIDPTPDGTDAVPPVRSLEVLRGLPGPWDAPLAVALKHGWLSAAHADALRRTLGTPASETARPAWRDAVLELIGDCWSGGWCPEDLTRAAKRMRACLDAAQAAADAAQRYQQRSLKRFVRASGGACQVVCVRGWGPVVYR